MGDGGAVASFERLRGSDAERLGALLDDCDEAVVTVLTAEGRLLWGSRAGSSTLFARDPVEYIDDDIWEYVHPDDHDRIAGALRVAAAGGTARVTSLAAAGDGRWVRVHNVGWRARLRTGEDVLLFVTVPAAGDPTGPHATGARGAATGSGAGD